MKKNDFKQEMDNWIKNLNQRISTLEKKVNQISLPEKIDDIENMCDYNYELINNLQNQIYQLNNNITTLNLTIKILHEKILKNNSNLKIK